MRAGSGTRLALLCALAASGCATAKPRVSPFGQSVTVVPVHTGSFARVRGELIAVSDDSLWVGDLEVWTALPLAAVDHVAVRRHGLNGAKAFRWAVVGGLLSGGALAIACASVDDAGGCGGVFAGVALTWLVVGGLSAGSLERSSKLVIAGPDWGQLRAYARFPQGRPAVAEPVPVVPEPVPVVIPAEP